ncbi:site-specific DNA-methyltransferase (adenine-specific) [Chitinophaga costaii]|uniref:Methyltransferase n=1 Tax=Chitinophaga costaii TaxID=1335309 RepID=A0A1C4EVP0_9BACT|nr:site-specific DNA-methyltransferase [Chitinophaga costaii]PUZ21613.1 site-specific DNA-methyltransferase [Chitinophaga costaii]SCC47748.1 site-specific DNA-methyltransferase (adenine-specific) [Chitinophaga costaii]
MQTKHRVVTGSNEIMKSVNNQSVHLVITQPPGWRINNMEELSQVGYLEHYDDHLHQLKIVFADCYRTLLPGGKMCVIVGDQFCSSRNFGRFQIIPLHADTILRCQSVGFDYQGAIIWEHQPRSHKSGKPKLMGSYPYPRNGIVNINYQYILIFKKPGKIESFLDDTRESSILSTDEWITFFDSSWRIPGSHSTSSDAYLPQQIAVRLIRMFSCVGDTILDPWAKNGITLAAARLLSRNSIGYEKNMEMLSIIAQHLGADDLSKDDAMIDFIKE